MTSSGLSVSIHRKFIYTNTEREHELSICCPEIAAVTRVVKTVTTTALE